MQIMPFSYWIFEASLENHRSRIGFYSFYKYIYADNTLHYDWETAEAK